MMSGLPSARGQVLLPLLPWVALLLTGCGSDTYPESLEYPRRTDPLVVNAPTSQPFHPNPPCDLKEFNQRILDLNGKDSGEVLDPKEGEKAWEEDPDQYSELLANLYDDLYFTFGTPALPKVEVADTPTPEELKLDEKTLALGSKLYRRHCLTCHGLTGDGRGPTGPWVNPHPRDYRSGLFKFISVPKSISPQQKPRRSDLYRTIQKGIDGTSMPSHALLSHRDLEALVSYVIHLSIRGEVEFIILRDVLRGQPPERSTDEVAASILNGWAISESSTGVKIAPYPYDLNNQEEIEQSIQRGYKLFADKQGKLAGVCINCHVDFGRRVPFRYDGWGTLARPANLTAGVYRGGRRPVDLYRRIAVGISLGSSSSGSMPQADLEGKEYWDLVNFLLVLPHPQRLPTGDPNDPQKVNIREKIYGKPVLPEKDMESAHASLN
jgi:hypothetical protein